MDKKLPFKIYDVPFSAIVAEWKNRRAVDMVRLKDAGWSYSDIGKVFAISRQGVSVIVKPTKAK